ncbi:MAG: hypothetical protein NTY62_08335 [Euryarchaeota archaeon]|nr:hypothetical protein [Euryarchaeota archaeon]
MFSGVENADIEDIRRRFRLIAAICLSGDIVVIAVFWLLSFLSQDMLVIITALLVASGAITSYVFVKVLPEYIVKQRGLAAMKRAKKE